MAFAPYATLPDFKSWVGVSDQVDDAVAPGVLVSVTRWIDEYCDRHFWKDGGTGSEVARTFASNCGWDVTIDDLVPGSLTTLKTDAAGDGTFETTWSATDYQLLPVNRPAGEPFTSLESVGGMPFPTRQGQSGRTNRIEITGVWGWASVPDAIRQACLIQSQRVLKRRYSPEGTVGFADLGVIRLQARLDPDVEQLLNPYKRPDTAVLVA